MEVLNALSSIVSIILACHDELNFLQKHIAMSVAILVTGEDKMCNEAFFAFLLLVYFLYSDNNDDNNNNKIGK